MLAHDGLHEPQVYFQFSNAFWMHQWTQQLRHNVGLAKDAVDTRTVTHGQPAEIGAIIVVTFTKSMFSFVHKFIGHF
jgi:hypothetical protein